MSRFKRFEVIDYSPSYFIKETSIFAPPRSLTLDHYFPSFPIREEEFDHAFDLLHFNPNPPLFLDEFDAITDLIQIEEYPVYSTTRRLIRRKELGYATERHLQSLSDRVSDLELGFDRLQKEKHRRRKKIGERKYTWTAEIKSPEKDGVDRKYKLTAEIKDGKDEKHGLEKNYKLTAEIKGKGRDHVPIERTYTYKVSTGGVSGESEKGEQKKSEKVKGKGKARIVEIEEPPSDHRSVVLRQAFAKRVEKSRGKRRVLSPEDAAALIQITFRAYLIRRSQSLRALRELAVAKTKLKEIRALFHNFSYRRRLARDAEERQRFSEKIIVLLLTVDAIEGADRTVRAARRSMVDELEAMLDVVDPQPPGKSFFTRRRQFDMPDGSLSKELAAGVAQVVQLLDQEANGSDE
ncbi:BAG family molecular chaperone regulator 7-like [Dorcoceras hygrometricum]|uniref:BAG family molecular chaperone regulator 7-like n=1 Tax=Dorcoceras hygrometricum TaxID=472368 RepID=A0A2Z7C3W9_9LAMI|nr:BAG family molecular chaperone regulator 7-like [Dorcoceras hygrometricum]